MREEKINRQQQQQPQPQQLGTKVIKLVFVLFSSKLFKKKTIKKENVFKNLQTILIINFCW